MEYQKIKKLLGNTPNQPTKCRTKNRVEINHDARVNTSISCIDLIFCTNQSVISNHGVDVSIFDKCHHNFIYGKINIRVPLPPTCARGLGL